MLEVVIISFIECINFEVRQDSNNTCINKIIMKTISIKSPDDEDAKDGEPKSDASPQRLEMGTGASAELELSSFKS